MLVDSSNSAAGSAVTGAISQASHATGASFHYLLATAQVDSGLNPHAGASTSSARGLFQFIETTWLATMKQADPALGYGRYADAISKNASGHYEVRDPSLRSEILKLRSDPVANLVMAGAFTKANASVLSERLGRQPSECGLYIAHFLGAGGAARLITQAAANTNAKAADFFSSAAQANSPIFYDRATGAPRSVAQVRNVLTAPYDVARGSQDRQTLTAQAVTAPALAAAAPDTAGIANAFAAGVPALKPSDTAVVHGVFADANRTAPLAPVVSAFWGVPNAEPGTGATAAHTPVANGSSISSRTPRRRGRDVGSLRGIMVNGLLTPRRIGSHRFELTWRERKQ